MTMRSSTHNHETKKVVLVLNWECIGEQLLKCSHSLAAPFRKPPVRQAVIQSKCMPRICLHLIWEAISFFFFSNRQKLVQYTYTVTHARGRTLIHDLILLIFMDLFHAKHSRVHTFEGPPHTFYHTVPLYETLCLITGFSSLNRSGPPQIFRFLSPAYLLPPHQRFYHCLSTVYCIFISSLHLFLLDFFHCTHYLTTHSIYSHNIDAYNVDWCMSIPKVVYTYFRMQSCNILLSVWLKLWNSSAKLCLSFLCSLLP